MQMKLGRRQQLDMAPQKLILKKSDFKKISAVEINNVGNDLSKS